MFYSSSACRFLNQAQIRMSSINFKYLNQFWRENTLLCLTILGVIAGAFFGFVLRPFHLPPLAIQLINFPGEIFLQLLKLMILPLIFSSLISALGQMDSRDSAQLGVVTLLYYLSTMTLAILLGVFLVLMIHPGNPAIKKGILDEKTPTEVSTVDTFLDLIRNMFPENIVQASFERSQTKYFKEENSTVIDKSVEPQRGMNVLGVIIFCVGFGINVSKLGEKARIVVELFIALDEIIMSWINTLMWFAPIGICSLICGNLLEMQDLTDTLAVLLLYMTTVLLGIFIHTVITLPVVYFIFTRKNPLCIARGMIQPFITAFGTASSGAALPVSIRCAEEYCHLDSRVLRFVLPLGSTINMDGTALYEAVFIFIAQLNNVQLTVGEIVTVCLTATLGSIGMNSVPAGLVSILLILNSVGLPLKDISILLTVDWFLDRVRTGANTLTDGLATGVVEKLLKKRLDKSDAERLQKLQQKTEPDVLSFDRRPSFTWSECTEEVYLRMKRSSKPNRIAPMPIDSMV